MYNSKLTQRLVISFVMLCACQTSVANIRYINLSPVIGQLPQIDYPALDAKSSSAARYTLDIASANYLSSGDDGNSLYNIDGETSTVQQSLEFTLGKNVAGITNRWFKHSTGVMDQLIYDFHDLFGMPQNGRTENNQNQLNWRIQSNNQDIYSLTRSQTGFGDTTLFYEFRELEAFSNLRVSLSIPTGSTSKRTSTDTYGFTVSSSLTGPDLFLSQSYLPTLRTWFGAGASILHSNHEFGELKPNPLILGGTMGMGYDATNSLSLEAQLDTNSPYFDSSIRELGWVPIIASVAVNYELRSAKLQLGFNEDLRPSTSPDFSLFSSFRYDF
ncbi:hypothetical protein A3758_07630 [Oleiphilus sp. HI0118]|nr:hypothetical protein A3758_07630 [Oleiphilus sp. HI0118]